MLCDYTKTEEKIKAAAYVRMSTEHQKYSPENQMATINDYAQKHNYEIIETYTDGGRSGLNISGRPELQRMLSDVQNHNKAYKAILVLDVTRWGRFQDADESAHYEYICKKAGVRVQYCAEQFTNDDSPVSTIIQLNEDRNLLVVNNMFSASLVISRCNTLNNDKFRWKIRFDTLLNPDVTIAVRMKADNKSIMDYYLLPSLDFRISNLKLEEQNTNFLDSYRFENLGYLYQMAKCISIRGLL